MMPFARPSRPDLLAQAARDFNAELPGTDAMLRRSVTGVLSRVHGQAMDSQYAYLDWIARQIHPTTADEEMLLRAARLWLPVPRRDATFASGAAIFTGTIGADLPLGTVVRRADGALYATQADATFVGTSLTVSLRAQTAGAAGNCPDGTMLALLSPVDGVVSEATVSGGIGGGADLETLDSVLARLQRRIQTPPQGGSGNDYISWMFDAHPGITRAWCYPRENGPGSVVCRFCIDGYTDGIPLDADVAIVLAYLNALRPVGGTLAVAAPVAAPVNFNIASLAPSTLAIKTAITASLADIIRKESTPGGDYWTGYTTVAGGTLLRSHLEEAIAAVPGVNDFMLVTPSANVTASLGHISTMGTISWT